jgi:DNA invertase Pin-like site-specific DNA recombinase
MKKAITFIRFDKIKEVKEVEKRLKMYAEMNIINIVWQVKLQLILSKRPADKIIIQTLNNLKQQEINVDVILVLRYDQINKKFTQTAKLIKKLSHYGVRIISIQETLDENDPIFTKKYYSNKI